jgi:hypothetical protein
MIVKTPYHYIHSVTMNGIHIYFCQCFSGGAHLWCDQNTFFQPINKPLHLPCLSKVGTYKAPLSTQLLVFRANLYILFLLSGIWYNLLRGLSKVAVIVNVSTYLHMNKNI